MSDEFAVPDLDPGEATHPEADHLDEVTETEETECEEDGEPSHPAASTPPSLEEIAAIATAAVESATAPLIEQIESQQRAIDELTTVIEAVAPEQIAEIMAASVDSATTRLGGMCDQIISTLRRSHIDSTIVNNDSLIIKRQRAMMNLFLTKSYGDERGVLIKEFCSPGEVIQKKGADVRILENPHPWTY